MKTLNPKSLPAKSGKIVKSLSLTRDIRTLIEQAREHVAKAVNVGLISLYWQIGRQIQREILKGKRANYGGQIVATLSRQLGWSHFVELVLISDPGLCPVNWRD
jgi:hypothetical protein